MEWEVMVFWLRALVAVVVMVVRLVASALSVRAVLEAATALP
jgi:hypothetical protein